MTHLVTAKAGFNVNSSKWIMGLRDYAPKLERSKSQNK
jgi:hypothetical protein